MRSSELTKVARMRGVRYEPWTWRIRAIDTQTKLGFAADPDESKKKKGKKSGPKRAMSAYMLFCKDRRAALQEEGNSLFRCFNCYFTQLILFMLELELPSFSVEVRFILFVFVCRCGLQRYWSNAREAMARNRCADQEGSLDKIKL